MDAVLASPGQEEDQKIFIPRAPQVMDVAGEQQQQQQQRGLKRSRRDRGSTAKERISKMPPCAAGKRSSIYRGVTRHRWTGRYEAHLWDKSTWNQSQNKKGKQVYLGAYDEEEAAARAYDLAALKYWGPGTLINFPLSDYARDVDEMQSISREDYLASLRRKSSGFSRGVSKYRGVNRHQLHGRWEARIGRVLGNKYMCVGSYHPQDETLAGFDMAALEYRSAQAATHIDLSSYIHWLRPGAATDSALHDGEVSPNAHLSRFSQERQPSHGGSQDENAEPAETYQLRSLGLGPLTTQKRSSASPPALSLLLQSPLFNEMLERASTSECDSMSTERSEVSHRMEQQQQQQHQHHHQPQQLDNEYYSNCTTWGNQLAADQQPHPPQPSQLQAPPSPLEDQRSVYHSGHEESYHYQSVTSNYSYDGIVSRNQFAELALEDDQPPPPPYYVDVCHQQQQQDDHLAALTYDQHGGYAHSSVGDVYHDPNQAIAPSLDDATWGLSGVVPLSNIVNTCGGHDGGLRSRLLPWLGGRVIQ